MSRPQRCRKICNRPTVTAFSPDTGEESKTITLTLDEFEVVRLLDVEGQTQEQCAKQMEISRTTVTEIYMSARHKIAECIVNGCHLIIAGGITGFVMANQRGAIKSIVKNKNKRV